MNLAAVEEMEARFPDTDLVLLESGGDNLTLTFSPALIDFFIYVIDVAAGDKIPRKNGPGITQSDILVINKTDLAPYVGASLQVMDDDSPDDARRQALRVHQLQDRRGHRRAGAADPRERALRHGPSGTCLNAARGARAGALPGRADAAAERLVRQERPSCASASSGAAIARCSRRCTAGRRSSSSRRSTGTRRCPGCPASASSPTPAASCRATATSSRSRSPPARAGACHDAVGDAHPRDGRQLRDPGPDHHARGGRLSRIHPAPDHPAPPSPLRSAAPGSASTRRRRCSIPRC